MKENIIDRLKHKEKEMEALIEEARVNASRIKADAVKMAREIKSAGMEELEDELKSRAESAEKELREEVARIEESARSAAEELKKKGAEKTEEAVEMVLRVVAEGGREGHGGRGGRGGR